MASPSVMSREAGHREDNADLEVMCMTDFDLDLENLRRRIETLCEGQESVYRCFCEDLRTTTDPARRREIIINFVSQVATSAKSFADEAMRKLVQVQAFCIANLHAENEESLGEISSALSAEIEQKNAELQEQASSRMKAKDEARLKFEEEKAALETSLREELVACQICMQNPRNVVIMPCLHAQFCKECLTQNKDTNDNNCPSCRCPIVSSFPYIC